MKTKKSYEKSPLAQAKSAKTAKTAKTAKSAKPAKSAARTPREAALLGGHEAPAELKLFWETKPAGAFFANPDFGEVRFLTEKDLPLMREHDHDARLWERAYWVAEEADGAVLGYLKAGDLRPGEGPVVTLDNEGSLSFTGATLVDHFGSYPTAAQDEAMLEPLRRFCEKNGLPRWRTSEVRDAMGAALGLRALEARPARTLDAAAWRAAVTKTQPGPPTKAPKPKVASATRGQTARPMTRLGARGGHTREGLVWVAAPGAAQTNVFVHEGDGFTVREKIPGHWLEYAYDATSELALSFDRGVRKRGARWERVEVPEQLVAVSSHARGPLYALGASGKLYRWGDGGFARVPGVSRRKYSALARDEAGDLYVVGGRAKGLASPLVECVPAAGGAVRTLAELAPGEARWQALCVGGRLVVLGQWLHVLDPGAKAWRRTASTVNQGERLFALGAGQVGVLRCGDAQIYAFDLATLEPKTIGKLQLKPTTDSAAIADHKGTLVVAGGRLCASPSEKPLMEPQLWSKKGGARAVRGCEKELAAQVAAQQKRFHGPSAYGPILNPA